MDPITALATIVQLLGLFRQETDRREDMNSDAFMRWLQAHNHNELKEMLSNQSFLQEQVTILLREDHKHISSQLDRLSELTMSLVKQFDGLAPLALAAPEDRRLPTQAIDLIDSLVTTGARGFQLLTMHGQKAPVFIPTGMGAQLPEPDFIEEDCELLVELGYLRSGFSGRGDQQYFLTRAGSEFGKSISAQQKS